MIDGGSAQVALYGVVQGMAGLYTGSDNLVADGDTMEQMGFRLRRARFGFKGWAFGVFDFMISVGADDLSIDLEDAWIGYRQFRVLGATLGNHKVPFSRYALTSSTRQALTERPLSVEAMSPGRQMGMTLEGEVGDGLASYALGVFNGFERHTNFHEGYVQNPATHGNRFNRVAVAGRVSLEPLGSMGRDVADFDGGGLRIGVGSSLYYNDGDTTRTVGWEADVALKIHGFHFVAEYLADSSEPTQRPTTTSTIPAKQDRFGLVGELGYMILPAQLGVAFRTEWFDDDESQDNNGDQVVVTGGVQYYWHRHHFKASLDFTHREELHGTSRDNDALLLSLHLAL